ncbi:hypothetical protein F8388_020302 [Cannabis sativa]|uniref:FAD-binding domain-containing protein n=1 Tax=Cannabis sativa TaxID=3483 RepID=A0A7J6FVL1_CANSA|nr:hypothetical protein F8388_020302 [Cannabis sativa]
MEVLLRSFNFKDEDESIRGLAYFPDGQPYPLTITNINGNVYWNMTFTRHSPGPKITDPEELRKQAREQVQGWPQAEILVHIIDHTLDDTIIRAPMTDRWLWPGLNPLAYSGRVVVVGDAWHPMTPNIGQRASVALEDSVFLGKKLAHALKSGSLVKEALM